jgi:sigma-B regulation protein RsbU (phosphoserine phosphatase)
MAANDSLPNISQMADPLHLALRTQLLHRKKALAAAVAREPVAQFVELLHEVDAALNRLASGTYGICEVCHEPVEDQQLLADPLVRFCLDHLGPKEQAALERDLELAAQIQKRLLPKCDFGCNGWQVAYHYRPLGVVSGDYCDLVIGPEEQLYFMIGDVAGKGVAAAMLMANLSAIFRALIPLGLPLAELMERANRIFTGSTLPTQFATLTCGRAFAGGALELCSAGHVPALVITQDAVRSVDSNGLPIGLFAEQKFTTSVFQIDAGSSVVLFSDGVSEARVEEEDYGYERIATAAMRSTGRTPAEILADCVRDLETFLGCAPLFDDQTLMVLRKSI